MSKRTIEKNLFCLPWTQTILGTVRNGRPNFMALDWVTRVNFNPPLLGICVNKNHASAEAIKKNGEFSVNVPTVDMVEVTDCTGLVSGRNADKSRLFEVVAGTLAHAPMIASCPVNIECRLIQTLEFATNNFFIAEIVNIHVEESVLTDGKPDMSKVRPFLLTMPDNTYWSVGEPVGKAWQAGLAMRDRLKR